MYIHRIRAAGRFIYDVVLIVIEVSRRAAHGPATPKTVDAVVVNN